MQISITGHHVDITEGLKEAVHHKLDKLVKHYPDMDSATVTLTVERHEQVAEFSTHYLGQDLVAKAKSDDLYQSIKDVGLKLDSLLRSRKEVVKSHSHQKPAVDEPATTE